MHVVSAEKLGKPLGVARARIAIQLEVLDHHAQVFEQVSVCPDKELMMMPVILQSAALVLLEHGCSRCPWPANMLSGWLTAGALC